MNPQVVFVGEDFTGNLEVYLPDLPQPLMIPRGEDALYLLQSVRDEAHRFALQRMQRLYGAAIL